MHPSVLICDAPWGHFCTVNRSLIALKLCIFLHLLYTRLKPGRHWIVGTRTRYFSLVFNFTANTSTANSSESQFKPSNMAEISTTSMQKIFRPPVEWRSSFDVMSRVKNRNYVSKRLSLRRNINWYRTWYKARSQTAIRYFCSSIWFTTSSFCGQRLLLSRTRRLCWIENVFESPLGLDGEPEKIPD